MATNPPGLPESQQIEIARRYAAGESQSKLAEEFGISKPTVGKYAKKHGGKREPESAINVRDITEFTSRARATLWRQDVGAEKPTYAAWEAKVQALEESGYTKQQATVQASKDYPCLHILFREYDLSQHDPSPSTQPAVQASGNQSAAPPSRAKVANEGKEQSYRDSLRWAIEAAGNYLRTRQDPASCPCDAAWYLYCQALAEPKDFLAKVGQMESKGDGESEERKNTRKSGQKSVAEIEAMLDELERESNATS
jgi:predicted transcriptional regulator